MPLFNVQANSFAKSSTATSFDVEANTTSSVLLLANLNRLGVAIWNNSTSDLYLDFDSTSSQTSYAVNISPGGYYEMPFNYTGIISGFWDATNGKAIIREFT